MMNDTEDQNIDSVWLKRHIKFIGRDNIYYSHIKQKAALLPCSLQ